MALHSKKHMRDKVRSFINTPQGKSLLKQKGMKAVIRKITGGKSNGSK